MEVIIFVQKRQLTISSEKKKRDTLGVLKNLEPGKRGTKKTAVMSV